MTVIGGRTSLVDLALSSVTNTAGDFLTLIGGVVHKRTAAEVRTDIGAGTVTSVAALTLGTSGTDLSSTVANATTTPVITLNVPTASATNRGALSSADWSTFNSKQNALTLTTTGTSGAATLVGATLNIPQYQAAGTYVTGVTASSPLASSGGTTPNITIQQASGSQNGFLSSTDWTTFNNKQNALTNPVTGTGTSGQVAYFTGTSAISSESALFWDSTNDRLGIGITTPTNPLHIVSNTLSQLNIQALSGNTNAQINLEPTGTGIALIGPANAVALAFRTDATERIRITSDTAAFLRMASGTGGIQFNGDTAAANALDDYEEGTWTPNDASGASLSFTVVDARYTKIGRQVQCFASITYPITVNTNNAIIGGLPFTSVLTSGGSYGAFTAYSNNGTNVFFLNIRNTATTEITNLLGANINNATLSGKNFRLVWIYEV
jgi:hypothetical protein